MNRKLLAFKPVAKKKQTREKQPADVFDFITRVKIESTEDQQLFAMKRELAARLMALPPYKPITRDQLRRILEVCRESDKQEGAKGGKSK